MNLPNKLTLLRVFLVPIFLLFFYIEKLPHNYTFALVIFAIASITDALDGYIARKQNLITNFGKFLDPLADKVLVVAALCCFVEKNLISAIPLIIIVTREFTVSGLRLVVANDGVVVPASISGKLKTAFTMVTIVFVLVLNLLSVNLNIISFENSYQNTFYLITQILIWISTILTIFSGMVYLKAYWKYIDSSK